MAETNDAPQIVTSTEEKTPGKIVSRGQSTPAAIGIPKIESAATATEEVTETAAAEGAGKQGDATALPEVSDEQLKELLKSKGIELDEKGFEGLKEKITPAAAAAPELTDEQKAAAEAAFEKRMLDFYIENGGTAESFVAFKQVAAMDLKTLSESEIRKELKEANFTDEEIKAVLTERYYQINPEELVQGDEETDEEFSARKAATEKKIAYGSKKLENKGSYTKKQAEAALNQLREMVKLQDLQKDEENRHSTGVKEFFSKLPRKATFQLGKTDDGQELPTVEYDIKEEHITEVQNALADPATRKQLLFNDDGSLNLTHIGEVLLKNKYLEDALKKSFISGDKSGRDAQVAIFEKTFPGRTAKEVGVGGANNGSNQNARKGHIVSRGTTEVVRR